MDVFNNLFIFFCRIIILVRTRSRFVKEKYVWKGKRDSAAATYRRVIRQLYLLQHARAYNVCVCVQTEEQLVITGFGDGGVYKIIFIYVYTRNIIITAIIHNARIYTRHLFRVLFRASLSASSQIPALRAPPRSSTARTVANDTARYRRCSGVSRR